MGKVEYSCVVLLVAFVAATSAGPAGLRSQKGGATQCSKTCTESSKFNYEVGSTYEYKYEVDTKTSVLGASEDTSVIGITTLAHIEVISKCEHVLKLSKVTIVASDSKKITNQDNGGEFATGLETYPLRYSFQDGHVESVCAHDSEQPWALNFKKGVLSAFQNTMTNFKVEDQTEMESDVVGKCKTEYKIAQEGWRSIVVKKSKDMSSCSKRNGFETALQTVPFTMSSGFKSLEILKGTYECDQTISTQNYITKTHCHELQLFRPFSKENSGAATETTQQLSYIQHNRGTSAQNAIGGSPQELYFDHEQGQNPFDLSPKDALMLLRRMCTSTAADIKTDTPAEFASLVYLMKRMNFAGLKRVYNQVQRPNFCAKNGERIKKFVIDALPMVGTAPAVELMKTLISNDNIKGSQADMWLASLAFIHNPTSDMIEQVMQLTGLPTLSTKVLLPLSSLVHAYCRVNPDCKEVREVKEVIQLLERNIGGGCVADKQNFRKIMMSLRGLGNTGHADFAAAALDTCMNSKDNSMDIRVAAIQAFRRLSCAADRTNVMSVFSSPGDESELRINAYLEVIRCPTPEVISQIRRTLAAEAFQQVGSFVWTHLTNLMESSDPANKYVQQLLNDDILEQEFDLEKLKFSRNYEASAYMDRLNAGGKLDSNVIFSLKSFVPRSASLNLTFNLFGESMNLFEVGGRVEGLEYLLESYFGPMGYFNNEKKDNNKVPQKAGKMAGLSSNKLNSIHGKSKKVMDDLRGAFYTRMFGNEMSYNMFGINNGVDDEIFKPDMFEFLNKLRNNEKQELSMSKSIMFLDSSYTVPTVAGLPLKLSVNGTSTVALNANGKIDMKKPASKVVMEGMFEPSGAVQVDSMMSVDAFVTKGGLKMVSTLYTTTGAKAKMELTNGNVFDLSFDLTKEKSEIINVKTSFFMVHNKMEKEQRMIVADRYEKSSCSGSKVLKLTGLEFCVGVSGPNATHKESAPNFPLTGPMSISVSMDKKDLPNGYKLEAKTIKIPDQVVFRFLSETPGSDTSRAVGLDIDLHKKAKTVDVNFLSPWSTISMNGELIDNAKVKGLVGTIDVDKKKRVYKLDAKILIEEVKDRITYTPSVTLEVPDWKNVYLTGLLNYKMRESFDADLTITGALDNPITFLSTIKNTKSQSGGKMTLKWDNGEGYVLEAMTDKLTEKRKVTSKHTYTPHVYVRSPDKEFVNLTGSAIYVEGKLLKIDGKVDHLFDDPVTVIGNLLKVTYKKKRDRYTGNVKVSCGKKYSSLTVLLDNRNWVFVSNKAKLEYNFGKGKKDTIIMKNKVKVNSKSNNVKVTSNINSLRNNNLDASFTGNFVRSKITTRIVSVLKYGKNYKKKTSKERLDFQFLSTYKLRNVRKVMNYSMMVKLPAHKVDVKVEGGYIHDGASLSKDISVTYHPERTVSLNLRYHNKTRNFPHYAGQIGIGLPEGREMFFAGSFGKESEDKYISSVEFEVIKGRKTKLDALLKIATEKIYEAEIGVVLPDLEPVRVRGSYIREKNGFNTEASFMRGEKLYRISVDTHYKLGEIYQLKVDTKVPERRIVLAFDSSKVKTERHNMIDIQWDADKNMDNRFLLNVTTDFKGWEDFEIASTLHYPSRTINFNMKHSSGARYITSAELSWSPKDKMEMKMIFRDDQYNGNDRTELTVEFYSPFEDYEELGLAVSIIRDASQYQTKSSVTWGKRKKILVSAAVKVPITANSIDIAGTITTPFKSYRKMVLTIKHRLSDDLDSTLLIDWGRERILTKVQGKVESSPIGRAFTGDVEIRTPFEGMRIYMLHAEHKDDGRKFSSKATSDITFNSKQEKSHLYKIEMGMTHDHTVAILDNRGTLEITIPGDFFSTMWEVNSLMGRNHLVFDILPQRGNRFRVFLEETHQLKPNRKLDTSFELLIPTELVKELSVSFKHEDRENYYKTETSIVKDKIEIYSEKLFFERSDGHIQFDAEVKSVYHKNMIAKMTSSHSIMPYNVHINCLYGNIQVTDINTYLFYDKFGTYDASIDLETAFKMAKKIRFTAKHERRGLNWEVDTNLNYAPRQSISVNAAYRIDHVKFTSVSIKTPFPQFSNLDASFKVDGNPYKFDGEAALTVLPYMNKMSTDFNWAYYKGTSLKGEFNLNTPFPQYPYMKAKVESNLLGVSRLSVVEVEYLPTQVVKVESDYRFTSLDTLKGTLKVTSPYTENKQVVASFTHIGSKEEFVTDAKITCECFERAAFTKATFSSKDAIDLTFVMDSPFRGYETVNMKFNHKGEIEDFSTHFEYETNGEKITLDNVFNIKNNVELQMTLLTPFENMSRSHLEFTHSGKFPNTQTLAEVAFNKKEGRTDVSLSHDAASTVLTAEMTTPFKRFEKITGKITREGDVHDFKAEGEFKYDQLWKATYTHLFAHPHVRATAALTSPLLDEDFKFEFNQTNVINDFSSFASYSMGPVYISTSETKLKYDLPNIDFRIKTDTAIKGNDKKTNEIILLSAIDEAGNNIYLKFYTIVPKVLMDAEMTVKNIQDIYNYNGDSHLILDLPHPNLASTQIFYTFKRENTETQMVQTQEFTMEQTMLERISYTNVQEVDFSGNSYKSKSISKFGDSEVTEIIEYDWTRFYFEVGSNIEGYDNTSLLLEYDGSIIPKKSKFSAYKHVRLGDGPMEEYDDEHSITRPLTFSIMGRFECTAIRGPIVAHYDMTLDNENEHKLQIQTPYDSFKTTDAVLTYGKLALDLNVDSSAMDVPIKATVGLKPRGVNDVEMSATLTSGFTNFTNVEFEFKRLKSDTAYTQYTKLSWEDSTKTVQMIEVDETLKLVLQESGDMEVNGALVIQTPFEQLKVLKLKENCKVALSPMRLTQSVLAQYNKKKYLDLNVEVSSMNKYSGVVDFKAPRPMTFSLTAENQGESMKGDLVLNWNKSDKKSYFRLQFGLSDTGDLSTMKKVFLIRVSHPDRIVGIHNEIERSDGKIISSGKVAWDEKNKMEATYDLTYNSNKMKDEETHAVGVKVTVPSRSVEATGSFKISDTEIKSVGSVLWDAGNDKNKQVRVEMILNPYYQKKYGSLMVALPSLNKQLSVGTKLIVNEAGYVVMGEHKFSYSPKEDKAVLVRYSIFEEDPATNRYRLGWSVEHKNTKTYIEIESVVKATNGVANGDIDFIYRKNNGRMEKVKIKGEADMNKMKSFIKMIAPGNNAELLGHMTNDVGNQHVVTVSTNHNGALTWQTVMIVDPATRSFDARMTYGENNKGFTTKAYLPSEKSFISETSSTTESGARPEGRLAAELEYRKLHGHMTWRPELVKDLLDFSADCLQELITKISSALESGTDSFGSEMLGKWRSVRASVSQELSPILDSIDEELRMVQKQMRDAKKELRKMYRQNELYMKSIDEMYSGVVTKLLAQYTKAINQVGMMYKTVEERMEELTNKIGEYPIKENYIKMADSVKASIKETKEAVRKEMDILYNTMRKNIRMTYALYDEAMEDITATTRKYISKLVDEIVLDPYLESLQELYEEIKTSYPVMKVSTEQLDKLLTEIREILMAAIDESDWLEKYKIIYQKTQAILSDQFAINEISTELLTTLEELNRQVTVLYNYLDMDWTMVELLTKLTGTVREQLMAEFNQLPLGLLDLHKSRVHTFDLEKGEIEFDLYLPIPMENFEKLMRFSGQKYMKRLNKMANKYFPRHDFVLSDFYYRFSPVQWSLKRDWVPPFDTFATISGLDHYTTFDGRRFDLAGLCSYLLVKDVVDGNVTIVQKYSGGPRQLTRSSLVVMIHDTTIEIFSDNKVKVNDQPRELPYITDDLELTHEAGRITLVSKFGVEVISDFQREYHIIGLSGWYFGKVAGILGSFDNEPINDQGIPTGKVETNLKKFMNAWEVDESCRSRMFYGPTSQPEKFAVCSEVFDMTASSLRPCFLQVDPNHFLHACNANRSLLCNVAALYTQVCSRSGITVSLPKQCMKCNIDEDSILKHGNSVMYKKDDRRSNSQDVVMIVEEKQCNRDIVDKLNSLVYELDQSFINTGFTNNKFSLLGYTGDLVYQHTMEGQTFNEASKFAMAVESLKLVSSVQRADPFGALHAAVNLPFRPGVARTFVVIGCTSCEEDGPMKYRVLSNELEQRGITLHVMRKVGFTLKNNRSPKSMIYGIDKSQLYTGKTRLSVQNAHEDVHIPQDYCSNLAVSTNGSVFDSSHVLSRNVRQQKQFMRTVGNRLSIVDDSMDCQLCTCEVDQLGMPKSVCRRCDAQTLYYKHVPNVMSSVISLKNSLTDKLQKLF